MKRSSSDISSPPSSRSEMADAEFKPNVTPPPKKKRTSAASATSSPTKAAKQGAQAANHVVGEWTPEKKATFMDTIIANGYKSTNLTELSEQLGMNKKQLVNQLTLGRKGSLRDKAVQAVKADK